MIDIKNVSKNFEALEAVKDVSMTIKRGHIHGLLGPNGAGKTTLIRSIVGLYDIDGGQILINGDHLTRDNHGLKSKIGVVTQHINLDKELSLEENLEFAGRLYGLDKTTIRQRKEALLEAFDLVGARDRQVKKASGGMKRKLMIAKALIHDPDLIILDEPTVGIDVKARKEIWQMLDTLRSQGKTMLLTTHYIEEAEYLSDMISLMQEGEIFKTARVTDLVQDLGAYCIDVCGKKTYFSSEGEAVRYTTEVGGVMTMTQLEDVYTELLEMKGKARGN